jgi:hypothetical protein
VGLDSASGNEDTPSLELAEFRLTWASGNKAGKRGESGERTVFERKHAVSYTIGKHKSTIVYWKAIRMKLLWEAFEHASAAAGDGGHIPTVRT